MKITKNNSLIKSFYCAFRGIKECILLERNMFIHISIMILVITLGIFFEISLSEWIACIILFGIVLSLELVNTAIENAVDICAPEYNKKAQIAKDAAAGAVLIGAIIAAIIGLIIFLPKILSFLEI